MQNCSLYGPDLEVSAPNIMILDLNLFEDIQSVARLNLLQCSLYGPGLKVLAPNIMTLDLNLFEDIQSVARLNLLQTLNIWKGSGYPYL